MIGTLVMRGSHDTHNRTTSSTLSFWLLPDSGWDAWGIERRVVRMQGEVMTQLSAAEIAKELFRQAHLIATGDYPETARLHEINWGHCEEIIKNTILSFSAREAAPLIEAMKKVTHKDDCNYNYRAFDEKTCDCSVRFLKEAIATYLSKHPKEGV